jgi:hypothetical protein
MVPTLHVKQVFCILMMCLAGVLFGGIIGEMQVLLLLLLTVGAHV